MTTSTSEILDKLAATLTQSNDLEGLVRPLLAILEEVTGLESTYLTRIDLDAGLQHILFARNVRSEQLDIPEGLSVAWGDTLCKRAIEEQRPYTDDVAGCWGDSDAARELGIGTYLSEPIHLGEGRLYGTLCGASSSRVKVTDSAGRLLSMLAKLIAYQLEREQLLAQLQKENLVFSQQALVDPLTGIPNRRALDRELDRALAASKRTEEPLYLAFIDLDDFKTINDLHGHDAGDRFLIQIAQKLSRGLRDSDFVARFGGDEFVCFGPVSGFQADTVATISKRLADLTTGTYLLEDTPLDYPGPSIGVVISKAGEHNSESLISEADGLMYQIKRSRKAGPTDAP